MRRLDCYGQFLLQVCRHKGLAAYMSLQSLKLNAWFAIAAALSLPAQSGATSLDELFTNVKNCSFSQFYYSPWDANKGHPYFATRKPIDDTKTESFVFKVSETLFGLPVVEIQVPGTWDLHAVTFDAPLKESQKILLKKLGSTFPRSKASLAGSRPALVASATKPNQSILYCNEKESGT